MDISIRSAGQDDAVLLSRILCRSWRFGYRGMIDQDYLDTLPEDRWVETFTQWMREGVMDCALAYQGDRVAGCVAYGPSREKDRVGWGEVSILYLLPEYMGKGVGAALLDHAESRLRKAGLKRCFLWALRENKRAIAFYRKQGYTQTQDELPIQVGNTKSIDYRFIKEL
jgi:GNAT superfamily N-acetyltransferase